MTRKQKLLAMSKKERKVSKKFFIIIYVTSIVVK